jgi:hypothetical protein
MTWPPIRACVAGALPLKGDVDQLDAGLLATSSTRRWGDVPIPVDAYENRVRLRFRFRDQVVEGLERGIGFHDDANV